MVGVQNDELVCSEGEQEAATRSWGMARISERPAKDIKVGR